MNGKKVQIRGLIILGIIAAAYSIAVFALPFPKGNAVFWLSYLFTLAALGAQVYVMRVAFSRGRDTRSRFYGFPIARVGVSYLMTQLMLGLLFMGRARIVPVWLPVVVYTVLLGAAAIGFIAADVMRDEIERQDVKLKKDVACMRALQSKTAAMARLAQDDQVRRALERLSEDLRFSDPVSSESLADIEADLAACVDELYQAVTDGGHENTLALVQRAETILAERNRLCRLDKHSTH